MNRQFKVNYEFKIERLTKIHQLLPTNKGADSSFSMISNSGNNGILEQVLEEV